MTKLLKCLSPLFLLLIPASFDLEPYWPVDLGPGETKASLAKVDITGAIEGLV